MSLPKKKSRLITVDDKRFRWLVSRSSYCNVTIEAEGVAGQVLRVMLDPGNTYKKSKGDWKKTGQSLEITPKLVRQIIQYGLSNGWKPFEKALPMLELSTWRVKRELEIEPAILKEEVLLEQITLEILEELRFDISTSSRWRELLFNSDVGSKNEIPKSYLSWSQDVERYSLGFIAFNDGYTDDGCVVFGIQSREFPHLAIYSTNNPDIY